MDDITSTTTSSFSSRNNGTFTMTGNNIMLGTKPKNQIKSMKKSMSQPELPSIKEMVNARTKKENIFSTMIPNYTVPKVGTHLSVSKQYTMRKKGNDGMIESNNRLHNYTPAPSKYEIATNWKTTILGNMKGGKRNTYITQIFRQQEIKPMPGPGAHSPSSRYTKKRNSLGVINKGERIPFTSDSEYLASSSPAAVYIDPLKKSQIKPFKWDLKDKDRLVNSLNPYF